MNGYKLHQWNGPAEFPAVITIFSAPNYCDVYNNKAAVLRFEVSILLSLYILIFLESLEQLNKNPIIQLHEPSLCVTR